MAEKYPDAQNPEGTLKIYLPDGHLAKGGLEAIWESTRLPYPTGDCPTTINGDELRESYGYPRNHVDRLVLVCRRPHNIPMSVQDFGGLGVSGEDFYRDKLKIPLDEPLGYMSRFNMEVLMELGCRPASILAAFPDGSSVRNGNDVRRFIAHAAYMRGGKALLATEFPNMATEAMGAIFGVPEAEFKVWETDGKTEGYASPIAGDADWMVDVSETGGGILSNGLRAARPEVLRPTKPIVTVRTDIYAAHEPVVEELERRLTQGVMDLRDRQPELFKEKLDDGVFA